MAYLFFTTFCLLDTFFLKNSNHEQPAFQGTLNLNL